MNFLQPILLAALPLAALPIIIHLINQRRFQTTRWAAMMFLLAANRMSRGYARLRQWLILLFRVLAIAGLIFAISRPLASGWLGLAAGGRADTTIVLLDRSPSMQQLGQGAVVSKLQTGRRQLVQTLELLGSSRWVLIESDSHRPREISSPTALLDLPCTGPSSTAADLPAMLESAREYIRTNQTGRTEIWICSDLRENDWQADSGRWRTLRDSFLALAQGVRFHLLAYPQASPGNAAVRVTDVRRQQSGEGPVLLLSLLLTRSGNEDDKLTVPVQVEIEGARSEVKIEMVGPQFRLKDHRIALATDQKRGWGRVSIPADANPADNEFFFVFGEPQPRKTVIVSDDPQATRPLELAAAISPGPDCVCVAEVVARDQLATIGWEQVSLLLWQAPLPRAEDAEPVRAFVQRGGRVIFAPPRVLGDAEFLGVRWQSWVTSDQDAAVATWRGDQDLLAHSLSGQALPVGDLEIRRYCPVAGEVTALATLQSGAPLLARVATERGGVYFCSTTTAPADSSLAAGGVVLYVAIHRALAAGAEVLGDTRNLLAGRPPADLLAPWAALSGADQAISTDYANHQGVYVAGERLLAVNREEAEDQAAVLSDAGVAELFRGLDFARVDDRAGSIASLVQEIWRLFLVAMIAAMIVEAVLCLPRLRRREGAAT